MSLESLLFNIGAKRSDKKRDAVIPLPTGITECRNISYGPHGQWNLLDVYYPDGTTDKLPTIVSIHGGGYVYGSKEIYRRYGMDMARRGFAFVNFNYRLAPKWKFPAPLADTNAVLRWVYMNAKRYHLDPERIILVGDSAGAQLASQYAAMHTDPEYASLFGLKQDKVTIRALGLNCGVYDMAKHCAGKRRGLVLDYLGKDLPKDDPRLDVLGAVTSEFPPAFITTAHNDFLRDDAEPMFHYLSRKGIPCGWKCYGTPAQKDIGHVFHVNILKPEAVVCNDDAAAFFRRYI